MKRELPELSALAIVVALCGACGAPPGSDGESVGSSNQAVTVCASGTTVTGVDVSTYQGSVDWAAVHASGRDFAITRVSDGTTTPDDTFATNWAGIKAAGMVRGVYQFFRASEDPTAQANLLVSAVGAFAPGDISPVADVEVMDGESGATLVANLATWVSVIESKTGRTPIIYASPGFWDALPSTGQFAGELSWVANWGVSCPDTSTPWTSWSFWQNADDGSVSGISGAVDTDVFNGSLSQLQALGGPAPYAAAFVSQSFPLAATALTMTEGETVPSYIELKNVGSKTWDSNTRIGTTQPRDRASVFADSSWIAPNRLAAVVGTVAPGATYKFQFNLQAPDKVGTYDEFFGVVEEGVTWFSDPGQGGPADDDLEVQVKVEAAPVGAPGADAGSGVKADGGPADPVTTPDAGGIVVTTPPIFEDAGGATSVESEDDGGASNGAAGSTQARAAGCSVARASAGGWADTPMWAALAGALLGLSMRRRRGVRR